MFYTIYKTTNLINNKTYIGKHQTKNLDDGYMGSGNLIRYAISKYGIDKFKKEILHVFDNEQDMNEAEKRLVIIGENSYNLHEGGHGGFGYINKHPKKSEWCSQSGKNGNKEGKRLSGQRAYKNKTGIHAQTKKQLAILGKLAATKLTHEQRSKGGLISGQKAYKNKTGIHALTKEQRKELGRKTGHLTKDKLWVTNMITNQLKRIHKDQLSQFLKENKDWEQGHFKNSLEIR